LQKGLLERRLVIVTGKGGTGKTTVSAALALAGVQAGLRVLVAEVGRSEAVPRLFHDGPGRDEPVGYAGRELRPGLHAMRVDPFEALAEYLGLQFGVQALVDAGVRNAGFRQLMEASPGWRELITLGKVWHLGQQEASPGEPLYDLVIVDAPATGHGVTFLDVPRVVRSAIRAGPLRRNSGLVEDMIRDQEQTLLLPVALGEELPARETAALVERARNDVGIAVDRVVVNAMAANPAPTSGQELCEQLNGLPADLPLGDLPTPQTLAACTSHLFDRHSLNRRYAGEIARDCQLPLVCLPYLPSGLEDPDDLATLADHLLATPTADGEAS
jgi:hypothetical protein